MAEVITRQVPLEYSGQRLDAALAQLYPEYSRSRLQQWIRDGSVLLDGRAVKPRVLLAGDEQLELRIDAGEAAVDDAPQAIELDIVYEDEALIVINKPAGLVVHPAAGHTDGTLVNGLIFHQPSLAAVPRAGIVHRLDKDTSGLMVVARTLASHQFLVRQLQRRSVKREYQALVHGVVTAGASVDAAIGRHPRDRKRMCVREDGKPAVTRYTVKQRFRAHSHLKLALETGRTHQIRVHMQHIHHPIVGDPVYGGRAKVPAGASDAFIQAIRGFGRQALHAWRLGLVHPATGKSLSWEAALPQDMRQLICAMQQDMELHPGE